MIEVLWHGRGGQGAFTAARLLGAAASMAEDSHALAFPSFGPERRGAPMRAFTKIAFAPIGDRSAITHADYVIYLDDTLLAPGWESELKPGGVVLVNSAKSVDELLRGIDAEGGSPARFDSASAGVPSSPLADKAEKIFALDANGISSALLGRPIPNTVFLGALSLLCDQVPFDAVNEAVRQYMPAKLHEKNLAIVAEARHAMAQALVDRAVARQAREACAEGAGDESAAAGRLGGEPAAHAVSRETASRLGGRDAEAPKGCVAVFSPVAVSRETASEGRAFAGSDAGARGGARPAAADPRENARPAAVECAGNARPAAADPREGARLAPAERSSGDPLESPLRSKDVVIPRLRDELAALSDAVLPSLEPRDFAQSTCYRAGHLVTRNAGWRNLRPVLAADLCTGCLQCYLYCPDGAIVRTHATNDQLSAGDSLVAAVAVDYGFCKGCGICVKACRFDALAMISEEEALSAERESAGVDRSPVSSTDLKDSAVSSTVVFDESRAAGQAEAGESLAAAFLSDYESEGGSR